ncbi:MAG TPA: DUF4434 domain-containing protein [Phycisphaerae bacterium]|nr:DUF4434 domain-containing protein [Phycisphaerae bacterium]
MRKTIGHPAWVSLFLLSAAWADIGSVKSTAAGRGREGPTPTAGLRLDGTFIQFQEWMLKLDDAAWQKELEAIRTAKMNTIVLQNTQVGDKRFFGGAATATDAAGPDLVKTVLTFADKNGMEVYVGLLDDGQWFTHWNQPGYLDRLADKGNRLADELWRLYGKHRSFAGWYIPGETWDGPYTADQIGALRKYLRTVSDHCHKLSGARPRPVAIAPFVSGKIEPAEVRKTYAAMLTNSGIDIVMLQDGVGARGYDDDLMIVVPYFQAMRDVCLETGAEFWSDLECFRLVTKEGNPTGFTPADAERIGRQMSIEAPFVKKIVTFDFFHYMSPYRSEATKTLYADYMARYVERNWLPALGRGPTIDPSFGYYRDRTPESIAAEIRANGYGIVHWAVTAESQINPALLGALHRERIGVWYMTWGNGTYSTKDLPAGWEAWKMVARSDLAGVPLNDGFTRLCLNNAHYRGWRKQQIAGVMSRLPFQGVEIVEPHWPDYPGPTSPAYACFCPNCLAAFTKMFPGEKALPDILREDSPLNPKKNPELWKKWLTFRQASLTDFLNDLVNGRGGLRETVPHAMISVWSLALKDGLQQVLEDNGECTEDITRVVKPDLYGLQTHWPDWLKPDLPPDYVKWYQPFIDQIRKVDPKMPILIQADTGSKNENRRSWDWIGDFERECWKLGVTSTTFYEYFIGLYAYEDPPRVAEVRRKGRRLQLVFTKRLDPASAGDVSRYALDDGTITAVKVDGNMVELSLGRIQTGKVYELTVKGISDAADRRLIPGRPPAVLQLQTVRFSG